DHPAPAVPGRRPGARVRKRADDPCPASAGSSPRRPPVAYRDVNGYIPEYPKHPRQCKGRIRDGHRAAFVFAGRAFLPATTTTANDMADVQLRNLRKVYPDGHVAVAGATLDIADGELLVLVGPSGCGKSTLLRMIAGLEDITSGELRIGGRVVNDVPPRDRDIAMVFQNYALYPHMTVAENLAFGLKLRGHPKAEIEERVAGAETMLGIVERPSQWSAAVLYRCA